MSWLDRDADHSSAARFDYVASDDGILSPIGAFDEDIRLQGGNQIVRRVLVEDDDAVDAGEPFEDLRALCLGGMGPVGSFDRAHRPIRVHADEKGAAEAARLLEVTEVSYVQEVEDAVGEHDRQTDGAELVDTLAGRIGGHPLVPGLKTTFGENVHR